METTVEFPDRQDNAENGLTQVDEDTPLRENTGATVHGVNIAPKTALETHSALQCSAKRPY